MNLSKRVLACFCSVTFIYNFSVNAESAPSKIVITANRVDTEKNKVGNSITIVDKEEIERSGRQTVADALRNVEGVDVVQSGTPGGNTSVFIRGTNSEHTLILLDGIELNNPISTNKSFNFSDLSLDNVERIEVLKGPQSTLYGSDALGGVINIITKKGKAGFQSSATLEGGSYGLFREIANISGANSKLDYALGILREDFDGLSSAAEKYGNTEDDSFENTGVSGNFGLSINDELTLRNITKVQNSFSQLDNNGGFGGDDINHRLKNRTFFNRTFIKGDYFENKWQPELGFSFTDHHLVDNNDTDVAHPLDSLRSNYDGNQLKYDFLNTFRVEKNINIIVGFETEEDKGSSSLVSESSFGPFQSVLDEQSIRTNGYFIQSNFANNNGLSASLGGRIDDNSVFGSKATYRFAPSYSISNSRIFGSIGTGFKSPSIYQLYSEYGSLSLNPEESFGWDAGVEQKFLDNDLTFSTTYFHNNLDELISFDSNSFKFFNVNSASTEGLESAISYQFCKDNHIKITHTYTDTKDDLTGEALLRRPNNKFRAEVALKPVEKLNVTFGAAFTGRRWDNNFGTFPAEKISLTSYTLFNIYAGYELSENITLFAKLDNLFDKSYEEVFGYGNVGFSAIGGVKVNL